MANSQPVTCQIRYTLDLAKLGAFETYARTWISPSNGTAAPIMGISSRGQTQQSGTASRDSATWPNRRCRRDVHVPRRGYRTYRKEVAADAECITAAVLVRESSCSHDRTSFPPTRHQALSIQRSYR